MIQACPESNLIRLKNDKPALQGATGEAGVSKKFIPQHKPLILPSQMRYNNQMFSLPALLDSGADENFMDFSTAHEIGIQLVTLNNPLKIYTTDGRGLGEGEITHCTACYSLYQCASLRNHLISHYYIASPTCHIR